MKGMLCFNFILGLKFLFLYFLWSVMTDNEFKTKVNTGKHVLFSIIASLLLSKLSKT